MDQSKLDSFSSAYKKFKKDHPQKGRGAKLPSEIKTLAKELRDAGTSQSDIAKAAGVSNTAISKWFGEGKKAKKPTAKKAGRPKGSKTRDKKVVSRPTKKVAKAKRSSAKVETPTHRPKSKGWVSVVVDGRTYQGNADDLRMLLRLP